jgi:hypothetical protein
VIAVGLEMSADTELAAAVEAAAGEGAEAGCFRLRVLFYGPAEEVAAAVAGSQLWCDPMPCAGLLGQLRAAGAWPRLMEAVDVAQASYEFKAAVRARRVSLVPGAADEALREAMKYAAPRALAARFAFERRRVPCDMSPVNAAAFAVWGAKTPPAEIF